MKKTILLSAGLLFAMQLNAQSLSPMVISSSGGFYISATAMLSTTVGEMTMVETFQSPNNFLTQGFQQPEDFGVGLGELTDANNFFELFPNPASDAVTIKTNFQEAGSYGYSIYNALGQLVMGENNMYASGMVSKVISLKKLNGGIYLLQANFVSVNNKKQSFTQKLTIQK